MTKGVWCALILVLMSGAPLSSQSNTSSGAITGTVRDSSGVVVAGAKITVDNESRAISRSMMTDDRGEFRVVVLPRAVYDVTAEAADSRRRSGKIFRLRSA